MGLLTLLAAIVAVVAPPDVPSLIPWPREVRWGEGVCVAPASLAETRDASLPAEGYVLAVETSGVSVACADAAGAFYARKTLEQLLEERDGRRFYRCCRISDFPAYPWRGVLIDDSRHFLGKETVKRTIEVMSRYKFNRLHWHLTDDQGWRLDIPGLPELAQFGSVRRESPKHGAKLEHLGNYRFRSELNGQRYGPFFYSRADVEEVVSYAKARHVEIVPEIELPGHSRGVLAAYPNLSCFPESVNPRLADSDWGISTNVCCVGNDETLRFFEKVLDYVCEVFPSRVIHIGGDECPRVNWKRCSKCQARMKKEGLKDEGELQGWITTRMAKYLAGKDRRIMGWDEILAGDVPNSAIGQSWRTQSGNGAGTELVSAAGGAARGFDMVVSPHTECYFNYGADLELDPFQYDGGGLTLERAYAFDPMKGVPKEYRARILGSEACVWGEYVWNEYDLEWKLWPRACATAELLWTDPQPRDFKEFERRAELHRRRLVKSCVNCQPLK